MRAWSRGKLTIFQSTLSVRRATWRPLTMEQSEAISIHALRKESDQAADHVGHQLHISIHALRKESDACRLAGNGSVLISIHALRKESDLTTTVSCAAVLTFQSTLSVRRATRLMLMAWLRLDISIHALRKESDCPPLPHCSWGYNFNPRSP